MSILEIMDSSPFLTFFLAIIGGITITEVFNSISLIFRGKKMQSAKKFRRPKRLTMRADDFARTWAHNMGSYKKAVITSDNYEFASRQHAKRDDISSEDRREAIRTANFYNNVSGILRKTQVKMGEQPTEKRTGVPVEQKNTAN